jgi:hypothetical protein
MMKTRLRSDAALRFADRRQREQDAPRLHDRFPSLATLRLDIEEGRGATNADPKHTRIIGVDTAPALFALTCGDHGCRDGGHDLTTSVLRNLSSGATRFDVEDMCYGSVGMGECGRTMRVRGTATYR